MSRKYQLEFRFHDVMVSKNGHKPKFRELFKVEGVEIFKTEELIFKDIEERGVEITFENGNKVAIFPVDYMGFISKARSSNMMKCVEVFNRDTVQ